MSMHLRPRRKRSETGDETHVCTFNSCQEMTMIGVWKDGLQKLVSSWLRNIGVSTPM